MTTESETQLSRWIEREQAAESMIPLIGQLYREHQVITSIHGRSLINQSPVGILKLHRFARQIDSVELDVALSLSILQTLTSLDISGASVNLGVIQSAYTSAGEPELEPFLKDFFSQQIDRTGEPSVKQTDVVLYGFGRIGRLLARILIAHTSKGQPLRLAAIVVRKGSQNDLIKRASLLRRDSVHGPFNGTITVDTEKNTILANGTLIQVIYSDSPASVDYTQHGISDAIVVDNTGRWRDQDGLSQHLAAKGVSRVLLTAPGSGSIKNIVYGINNDTIGEGDTILSAASCTTNAIVPVLKAVQDKYGIAHGHVETVHSYTNDQNLIDNFHKGSRRGRSAALNMVPAETGAAKAVAKALPELAGKLTGHAIRVPTPNVSMAILNLTLESATDKEALNTYLRDISLNSSLRQQIDYVDSPEVVSTDFVGSNSAGIVDGLDTLVNGTNVVLYVWYDNEFGYSSQVIRVLEEMAS